VERPAEVFEYFLSQPITLSCPSGTVVGRSIALHGENIPPRLSRMLHREVDLEACGTDLSIDRKAKFRDCACDRLLEWLWPSKKG
jgi:hypothetical protein